MMSITSISYLLLVLGGAVVYYIVPKRVQWVVLLLLSALFYYFAGTPYTFAYVAFSCVCAYVITNINASPKISNKPMAKRCMLFIGIVLSIMPWLIFSASNLWTSFANKIFRCLGISYDAHGTGLAAALGMGYYTCMSVGYILDCYWEISTPQRNPLKLLLFISFFPQMITGPISKYEEIRGGLYEGHSLSYKNFCFGSQRMLWGFCKKLLLAEKLLLITNGIWRNMDNYEGYYHWMFLLLFPLYLYADFSGCMDIVLGVAEIFGIRLAENFNSPFFSRNIQEFWQRWHITLGVWAKNYIMNPLMKSDFMVNISMGLKKKLGKKPSRFIAGAIGSGVVWFVTGLWHGSLRYIVGIAFYYWFLMELGNLCTPWIKKICTFFKFKTESVGWHIFQSLRTYFVFAVGAVFFKASGVSEAIGFITSLFSMFTEEKRNPWVWFDGSILDFGLVWGDINIILIMLIALLVVALLRERHGSAREWIAAQSTGMRWALWLLLFVVLLIYGNYGPDFAVSEFVYKDF